MDGGWQSGWSEKRLKKGIIRRFPDDTLQVTLPPDSGIRSEFSSQNILNKTFVFTFSFKVERHSIHIEHQRKDAHGQPTTALVLSQVKQHNAHSPIFAVRVSNDEDIYVTTDNATGRHHIHSEKLVYGGANTVRAKITVGSQGRILGTLNGKDFSYSGVVGYSDNQRPGAYAKWGVYNSGGNKIPKGGGQTVLFNYVYVYGL